MSDNISDALRHLLEQERRALITADLAALSKLAQRKERLVQKLARDADPAELTRLDAILRQNGALLAAAAEGMQEGIARLRALAAPPPLTTYDGHGVRTDFRPQGGEVTRRA